MESLIIIFCILNTFASIMMISYTIRKISMMSRQIEILQIETHRCATEILRSLSEQKESPELPAKPMKTNNWNSLRESFIVPTRLNKNE